MTKLVCSASWHSSGFEIAPLRTCKVDGVAAASVAANCKMAVETRKLHLLCDHPFRAVGTEYTDVCVGRHTD